MATLREVQLCQLDILKVVAEICDRHSIPYYLAYGTMLGAVRHKGFIPWDDDVDIYMRYEDLLRFKKICQKELPEKYFYQDPDTDIGARWLFTKVRANGTRMSESFDKQGQFASYHEGVWIDIFPLLDAADTPERVEQQVEYIFEYQKLLCCHGPILKDMKLKTKLITMLTNVIVKQKRLRCEKKLRKLQSANSDFMLVMGNAYWRDNTAENRKKALKSVVYKGELVSERYAFEDTAFIGFKDYDAYLTREYGSDYMTPKQWAHMADYTHVIV